MSGLSVFLRKSAFKLILISDSYSDWYKRRTFLIPMSSTEQVYMKALKRQISEWKKTRTDDQIREIMKEFMFNETLYKEFVRTTMLTCGDVLSHDDLLIQLAWVFDDIYTIMTLNDVDMNVSET